MLAVTSSRIPENAVQLRLEDLRFKVVLHDDQQVLLMTLPIPIKVSGKQGIKEHSSDHTHYRNYEGDLFCDCTGHLGFYTPSGIDTGFLHDCFSSCYRWEGKYDSFEIKRHKLCDQLQPGMQQDEILLIIRKDEKVERYLEQWVKWINEFNRAEN